jgi:glycosyltransferase involved in cell wall biosynthesis
VHRRPPQWWRRGWKVERHLDRIDRFLALSEFSRRMHREFGFTREMDVLPPFPAEPRDAPVAVDEAAPHPRPYFLFVGRLERIKGLDDLLPAFAGPGSTDLVIAGEGQDREALERQTAGNPRVRHLGWVEGGELDRWYRHAIALLIPSRCYETFGMIMLEAFRQSTPVIARRIGPFPEQIAVSGGGELFATHDELLGAMSRMAGDRAHRDALGRAGRAALEAHWSEAVVLRRYLELVAAVARERGNDRVASLLA